eukprot:scaffold453_cov243-Pinguiococcus_pyrenoidosus.AAC.10
MQDGRVVRMFGCSIHSDKRKMRVEKHQGRLHPRWRNVFQLWPSAPAMAAEVQFGRRRDDESPPRRRSVFVIDSDDEADGAAVVEELPAGLRAPKQPSLSPLKVKDEALPPKASKRAGFPRPPSRADRREARDIRIQEKRRRAEENAEPPQPAPEATGGQPLLPANRPEAASVPIVFSRKTGRRIACPDTGT